MMRDLSTHSQPRQSRRDFLSGLLFTGMGIAAAGICTGCNKSEDGPEPGEAKKDSVSQPSPALPEAAVEPAKATPGSTAPKITRQRSGRDPMKAPGGN